DVDALDEPLGQQVGRVRADQERHERNLELQMPLEGVGLEIVRGPAHRSQSQVRWPRITRRPQVPQKFSARRPARRRPGSVKAMPRIAAPRMAASSGSSTAVDYPKRRTARPTDVARQ